MQQIVDMVVQNLLPQGQKAPENLDNERAQCSLSPYAKLTCSVSENPLRNAMISAEGFVMFMFRVCIKRVFYRDVNKMIPRSVTVARCEQNASRDVNSMADLLWLYCRICFDSVALHVSQNDKCRAICCHFPCVWQRNGLL